MWSHLSRCEERNASGSLNDGKVFLGLGQVNYSGGAATSYVYSADHLGSVREMSKYVAGTTTIESQYGYDPFGGRSKLAGGTDSDFLYAGYFFQTRAGLSAPVYREYSSSFGRFLNRDPLAENGGLNVYAYVNNMPTKFTDPSGEILAVLAIPIIATEAGSLTVGGAAAAAGAAASAAAAMKWLQDHGPELNKNIKELFDPNLAPLPEWREWEHPDQYRDPFVIWPGQPWSHFRGPNGGQRCKAACAAAAQLLLNYGVPYNFASQAGQECARRCPGPGNGDDGGCPATPPLKQAM